VLQRQHLRIEKIKYIDKESNRMEEVEAGLIHPAENVYTEYPDSRRDVWQTKILPALRKIPSACSGTERAVAQSNHVRTSWETEAAS